MARTRYPIVLCFWATVIATGAGRAAVAEQPLPFAPDLAQSGWSTQSYPGISAAAFSVDRDGVLHVSADGAAGLLWRPIAGPGRNARAARWSWRVEQGVVPTDLSKRGADDRALGLYFIFGANSDAATGPMRLLGSRSVTALVYVFGGNEPPGSLVVSPHMKERGKFIVLRPADAPVRTWFDESVDLRRDYARAFSRPLPLLLGVAVVSDSDDTGGRNRASLRDLVLVD